MPIHHISLIVSNLDKAKAFYLEALACLEYKELYTFPNSIGLGANGIPDLWLNDGGCPEGTGKRPPHTNVHVALAGKSREIVDQFHAAALKAGGKDNGKPGPRDYTPTYYAAFIHDLDGNNIEVVHM